MPFAESYPIVQMLAPLGSRRRPGRRVDPAVKFIVAHDTGNPGATAAGHGRFYRNDPNPPLNKVSSAHLFVDDVNVIECIPAFDQPEQALHVLYDRPADNELYGYDANRAAIGVEYCYGPKIDADEAYARYVWVIARLCAVHGLDPARAIVGHQVLDPGRKFDPGQGLSVSSRSYDRLLQDVVEVFGRSGGDQTIIGSRKVVPGPVITTVRLNLRDKPARGGGVIRTVAAGSELICSAIVPGEVVSGNGDWCQTSANAYCWSGGLRNL